MEWMVCRRCSLIGLWGEGRRYSMPLWNHMFGCGNHSNPSIVNRYTGQRERETRRQRLREMTDTDLEIKIEDWEWLHRERLGEGERPGISTVVLTYSKMLLIFYSVQQFFVTFLTSETQVPTSRPTLFHSCIRSFPRWFCWRRLGFVQRNSLPLLHRWS